MFELAITLKKDSRPYESQIAQVNKCSHSEKEKASMTKSSFSSHRDDF